MRITLRHIAAHLGLDRSTISRGLRGDPRLPASTRMRIEAAADELGYRPDPLLSELASSRWQVEKVTGGNVIGFIDRLRPEPDLGFGLPAPLTPAATDQARSLGYGLEVFHRVDFSSSAKLQRVLRNRGITDLILGPVREEALTVKLDWDKFICVQLLPGYFPLPLHSVVKDHFNVVVLAWQKAVSRGYHRIGIVLPEHPNSLIDDVLRSSAVHACQEHFFSNTAKLPIFKYPIHKPGGKAFVDWVRKTKPDVIIGFSDLHYYHYLSAFHREVSYISLHTDEVGLSGIPEGAFDCAREAVNLLHFCRRTHQWGIPSLRVDHTIEPTWVEGKSLPEKTVGLLPNKPRIRAFTPTR